MILYHGTTLDAWKNIQKYDIDVFINKNRELDFGYGFYLGEHEYAKKVALDKAMIGNADDDSGIPVLLTFEIDIDDILKNNKYIIFHKKNLEFAKNVFMNRYNCGKDVLFTDFVVAPLADGKVDDVMSYYKDKENVYRKMVCYLNFMKPQYSKMKQYVFKKQGLCTCKNVISVKNLYDGRELYE